MFLFATASGRMLDHRRDFRLPFLTVAGLEQKLQRSRFTMGVGDAPERVCDFVTPTASILDGADVSSLAFGSIFKT